ncbi:MAG: hypothetical protein ACM359_11065 [Bacillota bacterium]
MDQTRQDITNQVKALVNPRTWVNQYPWTSLGSVTALGFLAATAITPARKESFKHRLQTLFPQTPPQPAATSTTAVEAGEPGPKQKRSMLQTIAKPLLDTAKTVLVSAISSTIQAKVQQPEGMAAQAGDGQRAAAGQPVGAR